MPAAVPGAGRLGQRAAEAKATPTSALSSVRSDALSPRIIKIHLAGRQNRSDQLAQRAGIWSEAHDPRGTVHNPKTLALQNSFTEVGYGKSRSRNSSGLGIETRSKTRQSSEYRFLGDPNCGVCLYDNKSAVRS